MLKIAAPIELQRIKIEVLVVSQVEEIEVWQIKNVFGNFPCKSQSARLRDLREEDRFMKT